MQKKKWLQRSLSLQETDELIRRLCRTTEYQSMPPQLAEEWKQRFFDYCQGKKTLPLTYDPFFKRTFDPDIHPDRLSGLIGSILGFPVKIVGILPVENSLLGDGVLMVMDMLVELEDGSLCNVEIQKVPYMFSAERMSCYSADILLRQYSRVKGKKGKDFKYSDIKKVCTIILFEKSEARFYQTGGLYRHCGKVTFDTGLELEMLQEFWLINLDIFQISPYAEEENELNGWLTLLTTENAEDVDRAIEKYPWLFDIYREMGEYMNDREDLLRMSSEALHILDRNTTKFMIEELQKEVEETRKEAEEKIQQAVLEAEAVKKAIKKTEEKSEQKKERLIALLRKSGVDEETIQRELDAAEKAT